MTITPRTDFLADTACGPTDVSLWIRSRNRPLLVFAGIQVIAGRPWHSTTDKRRLAPVIALPHLERGILRAAPAGARLGRCSAVPEGLSAVDLSQCSLCESADGQWSISAGRQPRVRQRHSVDHSLTRAQHDNSEVSNHGRDTLPSYSCRCVHRHRDLERQPPLPA